MTTTIKASLVAVATRGYTPTKHTKNKITADARHRALVAATCLGEAVRRRKRRRTMCNNRPASRPDAVYRDWRIPAPCYLLAIYRSLRGYPAHAGPPRVVIYGACPVQLCYLRGLPRVIYGVVRMKLFQLTGEGVGGGVAASRQSAANMSRNSKMAAFSRKPLRSSRVVSRKFPSMV